VSIGIQITRVHAENYGSTVTRSGVISAVRVEAGLVIERLSIGLGAHIGARSSYP
jgi:hypothetical protein